VWIITVDKKAVLSQRWPRDARYVSGSDEPLLRYGHSKLSKDGGLQPTWIWCNRKQCPSICRPWKPYPRTKHEVYRIASCGDMAIRVSWAYRTPILGEGEVVGVSDGIIRKSDGGFLEALHYDSCAVCNHSAAICDRMSPTLKSTRGGSFWTKISGCSLWSRPLLFGCQRANIPG